MSVISCNFGRTADGQNINEFTIKNAAGMEVSVIDLGACITKIKVPDKNGVSIDVAMGYECAQSYYENNGCLGAAVGRHANRIANASFCLNGKEYRLAVNDGSNNLHSNPGSYYKRMWKAEIIGNNSVAMSLESPDMDQGYPGNLSVTVTYLVTESNALRITYSMRSDADTLANMTNHSYFNLDGHASGSVLEQKVMINADKFTPSDKGLIPTGEIKNVIGTPFDFTKKKAIGQDINADCEQLKNGGGYDHNFVRRNPEGFGFAAEMESEKSGIVMDVYTDMPGMQFYTANSTELTGGKDGACYHPYSGACFETQFFPDSIHHDSFKSCILKADTDFKSVTEYRFSVREQ